MTVGWVTRPSVMDEARQYIPLAYTCGHGDVRDAIWRRNGGRRRRNDFRHEGGG